MAVRGQGRGLGRGQPLDRRLTEVAALVVGGDFLRAQTGSDGRVARMWAERVSDTRSHGPCLRVSLHRPAGHQGRCPACGAGEGYHRSLRSQSCSALARLNAGHPPVRGPGDSRACPVFKCNSEEDWEPRLSGRSPVSGKPWL